MGLGFSKSSSKSDSGAFDQASNRNPNSKDFNFQMKTDYLTEKLFGKPVYQQAGTPAPTSGPNAPPQQGAYFDKGQGKYFDPATGNYSNGKPKTAPAGANASYSPIPTGTQTGFSGGLMDQWMGDAGKNKVFTGQSGYKPSTLQASHMQETQINPEEYQAQSDLINKGAQRLSSANIAKYQDNAAYRGGGDLGGYFAQQENRNAQESAADQNRQLSSEYMGRLFNNRAEVNKYNADADYQVQKDQDDQARYADASQQDYLKSQMGEQQYGQDYIMELGKLLSGFTDATRRGSSSKGSSMGAQVQGPG